MGDLTGNFNGNISHDVGNILGNFNGNLNGNVRGNINGIVNGNINGCVFGHVNGIVNGNIVGDVYGKINGRVKGHVIGTVHGRDVFLNSVQAVPNIRTPSATINITTDLRENGDVLSSLQESHHNSNSYHNQLYNFMNQVITMPTHQIIQATAHPTRPARSEEVIVIDDNENEENAMNCCPICLETLSEIKRSRKRVMSSVCGHLICNVCMESMFHQGSTIDCPKCRRKLNHDQIHTIYI